MAAGDKLWFEVGVRDELTKELNKMIGKANELQRALEMTKGEKAFDMKPAYDNAKKLERALFDIDKTLSHVSKAKITATDPNDEKRLFVLQMRLGKMRAAIERFRDEFNKDPKARKKSGLVDSFLNQIDFNEASYQANNFASSVEKNVNKALLDGTKAAEGLVSAYDKVTEAGKSTNKVFAQLSNQFGNLVSVYGAERLLKSIITIGGQFEIQHVALQNILGDAQEANVLFEQLQALAVESPMTFRQIAAYTKQLAAFSIPADELFDTTRRLADLSTGLGVDMSRLILAYGQVRSAAVLRGQELRQFTEAGIPLVQRLADEFTKLNGKVVKTGEVFSLISKRQVPFEMVQKILWDMTNEGGQFYNMQALIAETLAGKWQKLSDVWEQALGRLAEGSSMSGKVLKGVLETVISVISNLEKFMPLITGLVTAMGAKSAVFGLQRLFTGNADNIQKNIAAAQRMNALAIEREFILGRIDAKEKAALLTRNADMRTTYSILASTGRLNTMQMTALYLKKQITAEDLRQMAAEKAISQEQMNQIMSTSRLGLLKMQAQNFFGGLFSFGNIATMGVGLGIGYLMKFISDLDQAEEKARQIREQTEESANSIAKSSAEVLESTANAASQSEIYDAVGVMSNYLKENAASWDMIEEKMLGLKGPDVLTKKYELLRQAIEGVNYANEKIGADPGMFEDANDKTGGWFSHGNIKDMKLDEVMLKATESLEKFRKVISSIGKEDRKKITSVMNALVTKYTEFGNAVKENGIETNLNKQLELLRQYPDVLADFQRNMYQTSGNGFVTYLKYNGAALDMDVAYKEYAEWQNWMKINMDEFVEEIKNSLSGIWTDIDFGNLTAKQEELVMKYAQNFLKSHQITNKDVVEDFYRQFNRHGFNLKVNLDKKQAEAELEGWQKLLDEATNKKFTTTIKAQGDIASAIEAITKMRKEAEKKLAELGPMGISFGISFKGQRIDKDKLSLGAFDPDKQSAILKYVDEINELVDIVNGAKGASKLGIDTTPKSKSGGSKKDKDLEKAKTQLDNIKKFYTEYKKYRDQYGPEKGQSMVEEIFGMKPGEGDNIVKNYQDTIKKVLDIFGNKFNTEERKKFKTSVLQFLGDINLDDAKEEAKKYADIVREELQRQTEQWNLYNTLFEKTGNKEFASAAFADGKLWNEQAKTLADSLQDMMRENAKTEGLVLVDWDAEERTAEEYFKKNFKNGDALFEMWKKIVALLRGNYTEALKDNADSYKDILTYAEQAAAVTAKYTEKIKNARAVGDKNAEYGFQKQMESELAEIDLSVLKDRINWDAVFGNLETYTRKVLVDVRKNLKDYLKLNRNKMDVKQIKDVEDAVAKLDNTIAKKSGIFSGLKDATTAYKLAVDQLTVAENKYQEAIKKYGKNSPQAQTALKVLNQAKGNVQQAEGNVRTEEASTVSKLTSIAGALASLGKKRDMSLSEIGSVAGNLVSALSATNTQIGNLIAAILSLLDSIGEQGFDHFIGNVLSSVGRAVGGIIQGVGNIFGSLFGQSYAFDFNDIFGDGYANYEKAKAEYESLISIWDSLLSKKKAYLDEKWGSEAYSAGLESLNLIRAERQAARVIASERLSAGASLGSHSLGYRMWQGSYKYDGKNWQDVADEISKALGNIKFEGMGDMLKMSGEQLEWIKENYVGLWSVMDYEYREHLENIIKYGKEEADIIDQMKEKLTGWNLDDVKSAWADLLATMENGSDKLAENLEEKLRNAIINSMVDNLFTNRLQKLIDSASMNDLYLDKEGNVKTHHYDAQGNITDTDVASEFTKEEYDELINNGTALADDTAAIRDMLKGIYGWTDSGSSSSSSSSTIKGVTEETANLIASYINAIRADVSVNRFTLDQILIVLQGQSQMPVLAQAQLVELQTLVSLARERTAFVSEIRDILHRASEGGNYIRVK